MKGEFELDEAPEKSCETCGHKSPGFGLSRFCFCCKDHSMWGGICIVKESKPETHDDRMDAMQYSINSLDCERRRHVTSISILDKKVQELQNRVKALEDQHRAPFPDPEKYELLDLGVHGKTYIRKVK
jgi:hypothetical protein